MQRMPVNDIPLMVDRRKKWSFRIYCIGIAIIIIVAIIRLTMLAFNKPVLQNVSALVGQTESTLTELLIIPLIESAKFNIIMEHLAYLLLWIFLWLLIPAAFNRITKFRFFNLEFELDRDQKEVISVIDQQMKKFQFLTYLMMEENKEVLKTSFDPDNPQFKAALEFSLKKMQEFYMMEWDDHLSIEVMTKDQFQNKPYPPVLKKSLNLVEIYKTGVPINKENTGMINHKNFLVYSTVEEEDKYTVSPRMVDYVIVISSYRTTFNENDGFLLSGISSLVSELHKRAWENLGLRRVRNRLT